MPEEEFGQPAPGQPHAGPKEKPGFALRSHVLPVVPDLLQVSTCSGALSLGWGKAGDPGQRLKLGSACEWK